MLFLEPGEQNSNSDSDYKNCEGGTSYLISSSIPFSVKGK